MVPALLRGAEVCSAIAILIVLTSGILPLLFPSSPEADPIRAPLERMIYWCFYGFTVGQVVLRPHSFVRCASKVPFHIGMVLFALLSAFWSIDASETLRRTFALGMATLFGLYLACRFSPRDILRLVAVALGTCAVMSAAVGLLLPSYGVGSGVYAGAWQGVFAHKNTLGEMMLITAIIFRSVPRLSVLSRVAGWAGVALAITLVVLSRSLTALIVLGAVGVAMPLLRRFRRRQLRSILMLLAVCLLCATALIASVDRDVAFRVTGKDSTLTGRTGIWSAVVVQIAERPLLGYGYGAFWLPTGGPGERVRQSIHWATPHSHNGFLDYAADLGLVGLLVLVGALGHTGTRVWRSWRPEGGQYGRLVPRIYHGNSPDGCH